MNLSEGAKSIQDNLFSELEASYKVITDSFVKLRGYIDQSIGQFHDVINRLEQVKRNESTIHFTGMGRSNLVGKIVGEMLMDRGYLVSFIGDSFSVPVREKDVIIALSGSGRTTTTIDNLRSAAVRDIDIISVTASARSELDRFSDYRLVFDWCKRKAVPLADYDKSRILGNKPHLTPMGTLFELTALLFGIAITISLETQAPLKQFTTFIEKVVEDLENTWVSLKEEKNMREALINLKQNIIDSIGSERNFYAYGTGTSRYVSRMVGMRILHMGVNIPSISSWRFRKKGETVLIFAEDGQDSKIISQTEEACNREMNITLITREKGSRLDKMVNNHIYLNCNSEYDLVIQGKDYSPSFDLITSVLLDSLLAQIAYDLSIAEESMVARHANVE
ncbi:MAG: SIS domain-containing protein [Candidatus Heimdallarchaeota archaeon]|nr:SIS domain-containing protein [Candidatus Heimdallarchaeota archaeon]MCK5049315.1 SIS domain-containing protein [Candidatus Heimdallarchaeota archaeon]